MKKTRYAIAKLEIEIRVLAEELIILESNTRRMPLPQLLTVWEPEIISSKLYIQLKDIGEEKSASKKKKKKGKAQNNNGEIHNGGVSYSTEGLDSGEGEGTYLSDIRRTIRDILEDKEETGGEDREGESEVGDDE